MPEAIDDPRFNSIEKRRDKRALVNEMIAGHTRQHTVAELAERLTSFEVPNAPILGIREAIAQPQAVAREMVVESEHAVLGRIPIINRPNKFPGSEQPATTPPPAVG